MKSLLLELSINKIKSEDAFFSNILREIVLCWLYEYFQRLGQA
jgi:hypothetical protein